MGDQSARRPGPTTSRSRRHSPKRSPSSPGDLSFARAWTANVVRRVRVIVNKTTGVFIRSPLVSGHPSRLSSEADFGPPLLGIAPGVTLHQLFTAPPVNHTSVRERKKGRPAP